MSPSEVVYQNFPHCEEWSDESFLGLLHDEARLDIDAYWRLEWALVSLTDEGLSYPKHLSWPVFRIFSHTMLLLKANVQPNDCFSIKNLSEPQEREFVERVQLVFEGFFKGKVPDLVSAFDERNPLLP